jgi:hypothetical protein
MQIPRMRAAKLASAVLAGGIALSTVLGPALLPANLGGSAARAEVVVNIDLFQRELSPYGRWGDDPRYGQVWYPNVAQGWRPYYDDGHWVYSDQYGWLWVSDASWGWAPFHYGRWVLTDYGWAWIPGTTWGPAWVTFRSAPDYIGWAPLPPEADWDDGYGFRRRYDVEDDRYWTFVRPQGFTERRFNRYVYNRRDYRRFIHNTTNITNITIINNRVVNRGIQVDHVERVTHRRVQRVNVADSDRPTRTELQGNRVVLYKPKFVADPNRERRNSGSVTNDQQGQPGVTTKKRFGNNPNQQQFVAPNVQQPAVGDNEVQQLPKKKRHQNNATVNGGQQQQFVTPEQQMQPSAGTEQLPVKKKHRTNANVDGGQQQFGSPNDNGQPQVKKRYKQQQQQFQNQPQVQQQPQIRQQKQQRQVQQQPQKQQQPQQQQKQQRYQVNKKQNRQCQNGDAAACGN